MIKFSKFILIQTIVIFLISLPLLSWGELYFKEIGSAFLLSLSNVFLGYYLVIQSFSKSTADFYKMVYGGMLFRMIFLVNLVKHLNFNR